MLEPSHFAGFKKKLYAGSLSIAFSYIANNSKEEDGVLSLRTSRKDWLGMTELPLIAAYHLMFQNMILSLESSLIRMPRLNACKRSLTVSSSRPLANSALDGKPPDMQDEIRTWMTSYRDPSKKAPVTTSFCSQKQCLALQTFQTV